jgi:hypothetical protein
MTGFFSRETAFKRGFQGQKGKKRAMRRDVQAPFSAKADPKKSPTMAYCGGDGGFKYWQPNQ